MGEDFLSWPRAQIRHNPLLLRAGRKGLHVLRGGDFGFEEDVGPLVRAVGRGMAVVGVGDFGRNHARVYRQLEGVELIGVVDSDFERARSIAAEFATRLMMGGLDNLPRRRPDS